MIAVTAFFEALSEADLPFDFADLRSTAPSSWRWPASGTPRDGPHRGVLRHARRRCPARTCRSRRSAAALGDYYGGVAAGCCASSPGWPSATARRTDGGQADARPCAVCPAGAVDRYHDLLHRSSPWTFPRCPSGSDCTSTRPPGPRCVGSSLGLAELRADPGSASPPGGSRRARGPALAAAYAAELDRPIIALRRRAGRADACRRSARRTCRRCAGSPS